MATKPQGTARVAAWQRADDCLMHLGRGSEGSAAACSEWQHAGQVPCESSREPLTYQLDTAPEHCITLQVSLLGARQPR